MTSTLPSLAVLNRTLGPIFVGSWLQSLFFGAIVLQATRYSTSAQRPNASKISKYVVCALLFLIALGFAMAFHVSYRSTVAYFGDYSHFDQATWTLMAEPAVTAMVGAVTHLFFLERCWLATSSGIAVSICFFQVKRVSQIPTIPLPMGLWVCASAATDITIGVILSVDFIQNKRQSDVAGKIIQFTMENGSVSAVVATLNLILYFAMKNTTYYFLAEFTLPCMYTLAVLATLLAPGPSGSRLSPLTLNSTMKERTVMEVKVSRVVERDIPDADGSIIEPGNGGDNKDIWANAV
ncbi:hypothetical protein B0H16DRAFT_1896758 [Mycena metata]|uniref:DUF6534 domain-containing protein n=1 Tax=Mycena metata TaxID=1033252 RepID=A0AAD7MKE1_9AGAR|nr:hypothetical protein B0H16DRAFT_1896758 [Mycena metata]